MNLLVPPGLLFLLISPSLLYPQLLYRPSIVRLTLALVASLLVALTDGFIYAFRLFDLTVFLYIG